MGRCGVSLSVELLVLMSRRVWVLVCDLEDNNNPQALGVFLTREECEAAARELSGLPLVWEQSETTPRHWHGKKPHSGLVIWTMEECTLGQANTLSGKLQRWIDDDPRAGGHSEDVR